jgi:hypothetical protein
MSNKVLTAIYRDGSLILDEKLDAALERQKLTVMLVEVTNAAIQTEDDLDERKRQFLEKAKTYSARLPENYKFDREEVHER